MSKYEGCQSNYCIFQKPKGMGTNGSCHCLRTLERNKEIAFTRLIKDLRYKVKELSKS